MELDIFSITLILVIASVVILAHVYLYRWVKFKIDEGVIIKLIADSDEGFIDSETLAVHANMPVSRVLAVCHKSVNIQCSEGSVDLWCLTHSKNSL